MGLMRRGATGIAEPDFLPGWGKSLSGRGRKISLVGEEKRAAIALLFDFYLSNAAKTKKYDYLCGNIHYIIIHLYRDERFY